MKNYLNLINSKVYAISGLKFSNFKNETEGNQYAACRFQLNGWNIIYRSAKITPKKAGQFVTFWKRNKKGVTAPLSDKDLFNFYVITVRGKDTLGQFVFPKAILIDKGIITTSMKEGKRGFRVYPPWDTTTNKQAAKTQQWQLGYFYEITPTTDFKKVKELFNMH
ncbi:MepB family protein [Marixanthomonas ophiurae]|uniref:MepB family protein n=1 Tax=Marixanthomonas ophiurae TaxID=387659 RepID=A0A3E1Q8G5_9FLAO|nr:MepB family protein [Marixanthomonas ophiurae]RFN58421.1 MepB family protein [Marixanthomonas ophiurae]